MPETVTVYAASLVYLDSTYMLSRLSLLFSFGVTVGSFIHSKDHCYFLSVESVSPASCARVRRSLNDDVNEVQS